MVSDFIEEVCTAQRTHLVGELGDVEEHGLVDFLFWFYKMTLGAEGWRRIAEIHDTHTQPLPLHLPLDTSAPCLCDSQPQIGRASSAIGRFYS